MKNLPRQWACGIAVAICALAGPARAQTTWMHSVLLGAPFPSDIVLTSATSGGNQFELTLRAGGSLARMRALQAGNKDVIPFGSDNILTSNHQWGLLGVAALDDANPATDDRFYLRQSGGLPLRLAPIMQVERDSAAGRVDVYAVAQDQWNTHLQSAVQAKVSHLSRYETQADGSVKVRRILRFGDATVSGAPLDISAPFFEETLPFHVTNFNRLAERLNTNGSPQAYFTQGLDIPQNAQTDIASTSGYAVIYNSASATNSTVMGVVFGKTQTAAPNQMVLNYSDNSTEISVRPGIQLANAAPGAILDFTYYLVPAYALNSALATRLNTLVAATPVPVVYAPGHVFTGELATIVQRLNTNLTLPGKRSDRLGHDVTPAAIAARPMLLMSPEDSADIRARLVAFPQTPENVLQNYLYGSESQKQAATTYFFRYPGSGDGDGLRTNYNTITARHMMWDQYRYDIALGLGYATQAQKDLMLSLTESFIGSKSTYIKPEGVGGGNLALEAYIAIGLAGLNFPDHPDAQLWLSRSVTNVKRIVDTYFPDGAGTESPRYHDWSLEMLAIYLRALERRAGIDLYDEPGIRSALDWLIRFSSPPVSLTSNKSVTPAWGDSTYSSNAGTHYYYDLALFAPAYRERDPDFSARLMGHWVRNGRPRDIFSATTGGLTNILMIDARLPDAPLRPNTSTYSPRIGHATLRSGDGSNDEFFASFKCGTQGAAHQDGDIGHLDLFAFGVPLALDSTSGPYDSVAFNPANAAHNTVRFNGAGAWDSVSGIFSAFGTSPSADYAVGNTKYGTVSNRHLVMMKGDYLVVWDETTASNYADWFFRVPGTSTLDWQDHKVVSSTPWGVNLDVHFVLPAEPLVEPTYAGSYLPTGDTTALRNQLASQATDPGAPGMFTMAGENRFGDGSTSRNPFPFQWLKYFSVRNASSAGDFLTVMHPRKVGVTPELTTELVSSTATAVTLRVTCNGRVDTIALTSTGATITKGNEPPVQFAKTWPQSGVSGAAGYVKSDFYTAPVTTLASAITTTGPVEVHTGELALGAANRIPDSADLMVKPGAAFNTAAFNETVGTLIMNGGVLKGSGTLTAASIEWWGGIVSAPVSCSGNFVKKGGDDWSRTANLTYSGDTVIESGNLVFQAGGPALPGTGRVVLADGSGIQLDGTSANISGLDVSGSAGLTTGTGTLAITGAFTGTGLLASTGNLNLSAVTSVANTLTLQSNGLLTLPSGNLTVKRLIINGVMQPTGVAVSAATHPGQIAGTGTITPLEGLPVPTGLSGSATLGKVALTWNAAPGVTGYVVRRSTTPGGPYTEIGSPASPAFNDTLVTDAVLYYYVVAARDAIGTSANSDEIAITAIGPWYFDPNGTTAGSVANAGSYDWVSSSWTKTPGGTAAVEAWGPGRHAHFAATNPGTPLAYAVSLASFSGAAHAFQSLRVANGSVTFNGVPGNFYFTQPPLITADAGAVLRFAQTGALAFNLNLQTVTFDGAGTTLVSPDTVIVNTGSIVKNGTGTLVLAAPNTYAGNTTINGGTLRLAVTDLPALWLDATNARTLTTTDGLLERWGDSNGRDTFVSQSTAANRPAIITDPALAGHARSLVDFGAYVYNATTAPWMQFGADMTDIRALFWVGKTDNNNFLLGSTATHYNFHSAGSGSNIWRNNYASPNIINGTTWLNGTGVSGTNTIMPSQDNLVRIGAFTAGNVNANTLGRDRTYRTGGIRPGEVMVFNTVLTTQQQADIDAYLAKKWNGTGTGIGDRLPVNTTVFLSNGATLDLTGINFQTLAGLEANDNTGTHVDLGAADLTLNSSGSSSFDGILSGTGGLRKNGSGQFTLEGTNTYTGPTTVQGGTLVVEDSISSSVTVKTGATLVNNGTITGDVIIESGGTYLGEGNITGTITTSPPVVTITSPGIDNIVLPDLTTDLNLTASIVFNAAFGTPTVTWSMVTGTGTVTFENPASAITTARFSAVGTYTLRCTATVTVNGQLMQGSADRIVQPGGPAINNFTATFRDGVNGYTQAATFIRGDSASWNSGARDQFLIGYNNSGGMRGLFAFDLAAIPAEATITSAAFDLWIPQLGVGTVSTLELRPLLKDFVEGTGNSSSSASVGTGTGADWNSRTGPTTANLWGVGGGLSGTDFSSTVIGSLAGFDAATTASGTKMGFTLAPAFVTEAIAARSAARPLRFMLTMAGDTSGGNRFARFASDDHATTAQRPQLTLNYTTGNPTLPTVNPGTAPAATSQTAASLAGSVGNASGGAEWSLVSGPGDAAFGDATQPATTVTFSAPGDYVLRLAAGNAYGETSRTLAVTVTIGLADWQAIHWPGISDPLIIGESADPDDDGVTNLGEFHAGTNPKDAGSRPSFVWTSTSSGSWSNGANWSDGTPPASHPATQLEFLTSINPGPVSITANNDNAGNFQLNSLTLSGIHTAPATTVVLSGNPLEFSSSAGALPGMYLTTNSSGFRYQIDNPIVLSADTTIDASPPGNLILQGSISGPGGLTRNGTDGTLVLAGNNTYTGPTVVNSGTLKLADVVLPAGLQIMPMGDSITYGDQGSDAGYRGPLYNLLNPVAPGFNFVGSLSTVQANVSLPPSFLHHEGHSGWTAAQLTAGNFLAPGNGVNPDVILLQIGTNDLLAAGYTAQLQTNLETLLTQLTTNRPTARILLAKITPTTNRTGVASYNAMVATVAANFQAAGKLVTLVDNNTNFPASGLADGTHPNDTGYQWLAGNWFHAIASLYATGATSSALATSSSVTLAQGATLDLNYNSANIGALAGQGTVLLRSGALVAASGSHSQFSGTIDGPGSFTKGGSGTLTLSGPNTYGGGTAVTAGTLQINSGGSLGSASGALALGTGASGVIGTVGNLALLGNMNVGAVSVRQNTATLTGNDIAALTIASGATLGTASLDIGVLGNNQRTALATGAANSGGTLAVAGDVTIGKQNTGTSYQSADLSGLAEFTAGSGSGNVFRVGYGALNEATLTLASTSNTVNVGTLSIGETISLGNSGRNNILNLGSGANNLQTASLKIGAQKASGVLRFAGSAGIVTISGAGGTGTANITMGDNSSASYQPGNLNNQLSLAGHQANVSAGAVVIGRKSGGGAGNVTASVTFDTGTFDADSISMAVATSGNAGTVVTGGFALGTTPASTGILTVANDFVLAGNTFSTNAVSCVGSLGIAGGTAIIHGNLKDASTTTSGTSTTSLTLNGGTLDMTNGAIGGNASGNRPITNLLFQSGILKNVAQINGGSTGLAKSSSGTLEIAGVNSYTGPTTINDGTLVLSGSLAGDLTASTGTLAPQGTPSTNGSLAIHSGGGFAAGPGTTLAVAGAVTLAGNLAFTAPPGLAPGTTCMLINKTSAGPISGAFSGKPEGSSFAAGGYNWKISYTGGNGNDVVVSLPTALDAWRLEYFGSMENSGSGADGVDANSDGESNLLEFATGQNPHAATRAQTSMVFVPVGMDFTYQRNRDAFDSGYLFTVEYSDTLAPPWTSAGSGTVITDGPLQTLTATIPEGAANHRFVRLRVTAP